MDGGFDIGRVEGACLIYSGELFSISFSVIRHSSYCFNCFYGLDMFLELVYGLIQMGC